MEKIFKTIYEEVLCNEEDIRHMNKRAITLFMSITIISFQKRGFLNENPLFELNCILNQNRQNGYLRKFWFILKKKCEQKSVMLWKC